MLPSFTLTPSQQAKGELNIYRGRLPSPPRCCRPRARTNWEYGARIPASLRKPATNTPHTAQKRLPSKQFQVLLTFLSKSFSSFAHATCSLSVSRPYLALDGTYHPLRAAIPNNSTLRLSKRTQAGRGRRGYHSLWRSVPGTLALRQLAAKTPADYNSRF